MSRGLKKVMAGLMAGLLGAALAIGALSLNLLESLEAVTFDLRARVLSRPGISTDDIRIILLDQKSLDWSKEQFGLGWPWPRQAYVPLVDFCREAGVAALAFDVVFTEPSVYGVNDDAALADAFKKMGRVTLAADFARKDGSATAWPDYIPAPLFPLAGDTTLYTSPVATFPIQDLAVGITGVGNVNVSPDADTIYRRIPLLIKFDDRYAPSLPLSAALMAEPLSITLAPTSVTIGSTPIPVTNKGEAILNYRGKNAYKAYSAASIMESGMRMADGQESLVDLNDFTGKYVFFGFSATGLFDLRPTPLGGVSPGVLINATALDNMLSGDFMYPMELRVDILTTILFALLAGLSVTLFRNLWLTIAASGVTLALPVGFAMGTYYYGIWSGMAVQLASCFTALFLAGAIKYATEGRQKRFIKSAFKQYLSPKVIDQLLANPDKLTLGGERRELTIFFSDLEGFTSISEGLNPEELTSVLNDYLTAMTNIIQSTGGTVDKYEGDAIIAFWNAPVDQPDHALRGVCAALDCQQKLAEMRPELFKRTGKSFHMRIGLNTGPAVVGNLGSHDRFDYTMLGDSVNLAARLESVNKQFATYTMISRATLEQLHGKVPVRELSCLRVVGKDQAVVVYEPMTEKDYEEKKEVLHIFSRGLEHFYAGDFEKGRETFASIAEKDPAASRYEAKCRMLAKNPPSLWDGVWSMTSK
ncbi:CHASE2 domain-containing protein [Pseudodesulfovibrio sediminis]|uniref:Adenylate/guanylate cyclase domain-containing protein n=1 Tax=Pseudodesulfovibrio sediminis TaxID=2810563 RepID=A0ABN6ERY4_9BACT|nr:adenylate/guanylate cyclase domain-containing protein [Pseudodesulfovibrio sediminis]BCS87994.1 adenylate/guanylate cyclase domain-containing protein [Pseudodesulfovibrio sediminis]